MSATTLGFSRAAAIASRLNHWAWFPTWVRSKFTWRLAETKPGAYRMVSFVAGARKSSSASARSRETAYVLMIVRYRSLGPTIVRPTPGPDAARRPAAAVLFV